MSRLLSRAVMALALVTVSGCWEYRPGRCDRDGDCQSGFRCNVDPTPQGNGRCVPRGADGCAANADCKSATKPICDQASNTCRGCSDGGECVVATPAMPVCVATGACVECGMSSQCAVAAKPICDMTSSACRACASGPECATRDAMLPVCASSGKCVQCVANADCKSATKPICDAGANTCRACQADSECTAGPQVCMKHQDGRCATDAETIYVQKNAACSDASGATGGTAGMPFCSMQPATITVGTARALIVVRGPVNGASSGFVGGASQISIVGQSSATVGGVNTGILLTAGDAYARGLRVSTTSAIGCQAGAGSTLRLDHVLVTGNSGGGILLDGAAFDIRNTTVTNNGPGTQGAITWGGILVNNPPSAGPAQLQLLTVQNNMGGGVACSAALAMTSGVLATANTVPDINTTCGFPSCVAASSTCGAQP